MLLDKYLPRIEFDSYEDFKENYKVNVPDNFNFGFDIVDEWATQEPDSLLWYGAMTIMKKKNLRLLIFQSFQIRLRIILKV